jgi:hypothetical protein
MDFARRKNADLMQAYRDMQAGIYPQWIEG